MQARVLVMWNSVTPRPKRKPWQSFGHANVSMCTCTALDSNCTQITSHWKQSTPADRSRVHESKDIADPLSRLLQENKQAKSSSAHKVSDEFVRFVAVTATPRAVTTCEIEEASSEDREFVELRQCIKNGNWKGDQHKQYIPVCSELCVIGKLTLRDTRIVIPSKLRPRVLSLAQ